MDQQEQRDHAEEACWKGLCPICGQRGDRCLDMTDGLLRAVADLAHLRLQLRVMRQLTRMIIDRGYPVPDPMLADLGTLTALHVPVAHTCLECGTNFRVTWPVDDLGPIPQIKALCAPCVVAAHDPEITGTRAD